jgi:hypothetical protein
MNSNYKIRVKLIWGELPEDVDIKTSVGYIPDTESNKIVATSLYYTLHPTQDNSNSSPDAVITINKNRGWDCGYNIYNNLGNPNLSYAMLRSIALVLGFGSSLVEKKYDTGNIIAFHSPSRYSPFDWLLTSSTGRSLYELKNTGKRQNPDILNFGTGVYGDVYIEGISTTYFDSKYKMYTPPTYEIGKSMSYLDNNVSLMDYRLMNSVKKMQIDSVTVSILNKIGWNVEPASNNLSIVGKDIPDSGITSAYTSHSFQVEGDDVEKITNAQWSFYLPKADGTEVIEKSESGNLDFSIEKINNPDDYEINVNGDIYGKILFSCTLNGEVINLQYNVTLELKPSITNVNFVKQTKEGMDSYDLICEVDYRGAEYLYVTIEEEYGSTLRSQFIREPYLAHFVCKNITSPYYAWVDIVAENSYGNETHTIELAPVSKTAGIHRLSSVEDYSAIKVFDISGKYVKSFQSIKDIASISSGIYVLQFLKGDKVIRTSKIIK